MIEIKEDADRKVSYRVVEPFEMQSLGLIGDEARSVIPHKATHFMRHGNPDLIMTASGKVIVEFKRPIDADAFAARWGLTQPKAISVDRNLWVFVNATTDNDVAICAKIADDESVSYARPSFMVKAKLL
jgi:hypothetical protein